MLAAAQSAFVSGASSTTQRSSIASTLITACLWFQHAHKPMSNTSRITQIDKK